jgi:transcriptional regulator with XRE-family HTH domain
MTVHVEPDRRRLDEQQARVRAGARAMATQIEINERRARALAMQRPDHLDLLVADESRNADTGRQQLAVDPTLRVIGRYLRRSRRYLGKTQQQLADSVGLSQSMVSRAERGVAPAMRLERLLLLCTALGRLFPIGSCPHDHDCAWQPIRPAEPPDPAAYLAFLLNMAGET